MSMSSCSVDPTVELSPVYSVLDPIQFPETDTSRNIIYDSDKCPTVRGLNRSRKCMM